ncbi:MAG: RagB/SusD family nutrient uptake outer membrane protein [Tannerellaceae bacterium]|jgi:hypothetical protein|nr:RagB/SusD family nutrient uptake outer membrane protein [Tannerellaceae bacterium]
MKNRIYSILTAVLSVISFTACVDLDMPSDGRVQLEDIFASEIKIRNYYGTCLGLVPNIGFTYGNYPTPLASFCDEAEDVSDRSSSLVYDWYVGGTSSNYNPLTFNNDPWAHYFQAIRRCNTFLQQIEASTVENLNQTERSGWIAEIRVIRAFSYLQLIKRYGGVPLIDTPYEVTHDFSADKRASFEEVADFIIQECDAALATPESEGQMVGFLWKRRDEQRKKIPRAFALAVKSQTALYAASPLWYESGSKYTWEKAAEITKSALDKCLENGYQLYDTQVDESVAQNTYAYYFIQRSDPSRSVDKETIFESNLVTNVWEYAGTPVWEGMERAGACPSQELVDSYETSNGQPVLDLNEPYLDANHLQPKYNTNNTLYDPANPYANRDPRFYASIYYNNSDRTLRGNLTKTIVPIPWYPASRNNIDVTENEDGSITFKTVGDDPWITTDYTGEELPPNEKRLISFEYKSNKPLVGGDMAMFFFCGDWGVFQHLPNPFFEVPQASDWTRIEYDLSEAIETFGFSKSPKDWLRFDPGANEGLEITIRNFQMESFTPPPPAMLVETFVGGNCAISENVTNTRFTRTGYYLRKFNNYRSNVNVDADGCMKLFRLGELYLNFAEAACQAQGPDAVIGGMSAREAVNAIRTRAGMPGLPAGMSNDEFEKRYRNERRIELAFEEHRFFDTRRWKILNETDGFVTGMKITKNANGAFNYERIKMVSRQTAADKYLIFPIWQSEVAKMGDYTGGNWQNPGW